MFEDAEEKTYERARAESKPVEKPRRRTRVDDEDYSRSLAPGNQDGTLRSSSMHNSSRDRDA